MKRSATHISNWRLTIPARDWQTAALQKWEQSFKGIVSVVTGGGKTMFAFLCILKFKEYYPYRNFIVIVPTLTLLDQWYLSLVEDLNVAPGEIACFSSQEKNTALKKINIFSINKARSYLPKLKEQENYFLIVDECHRAGSRVNSNAIDGNYSATLGLSATPSRQYDDGYLRYIQPALGEIIYKYDYNEALKDKAISSFELKNIKVPFLKHEETKYSKISKKLKFLLKKFEDDKSLGTTIKNCLIQRSKVSTSALMRVPVTVKIVKQHINNRLIIFHESIEAANEIYDLLGRKKYPVALYHSKISPVLRRNNLQMYKKGIYNILITCKALDEGMNVPETTIAIIASSTSSLRQRVQRLGRVLRPFPGKEKATIYTLYITDQEQSRLSEEYKKFEDDISITWFKAIS